MKVVKNKSQIEHFHNCFESFQAFTSVNHTTGRDDYAPYSVEGIKKWTNADWFGQGATKRNGNFEKHACQNMVATETSSHVDSQMSYQIDSR